MIKNNKLPLILLLTLGSLFTGLLIGLFLGRTAASQDRVLSKYDYEATTPTYTYAYRNDTTGKININFASEDELSMLPGIGEETAKRIVAYRTKHGIFFSINDLKNVKGIGEKTLEKLAPYITVGG